MIAEIPDGKTRACLDQLGDVPSREIGKKRAFANLQQETFFNLMRTHALMSSEFRQKLFKPLGLSHEKHHVLRLLAGENRPMQIYEVADRMIAPKSDISRIIDRLVATEHISRERCDQDGRVAKLLAFPSACGAVISSR